MHRHPKLYIHVKQATHFLEWEKDEFSKYFDLVAEPSTDTLLLAFGPDVLEEASKLPAVKRFAVLFPGFTHNPLHNLENRKLHEQLIGGYYDTAFINPGPLELAYQNLNNIELYPFSVDTNSIRVKKYRTKIKSLLHVSSDSPQKDWQRSELIMQKTGMKYEVYPQRETTFFDSLAKRNNSKNNLRRKLGIPEKKYLPRGYVDHNKVIRKYQQYDAFVHIAKDIKDKNNGVDGKYTAALIEAGLTGAILFWHDTYNLGNGLKTVFNVAANPDEAAKQIIEISNSINVPEHSRRTRQEMLETFNPQKSVGIRVKKMLEVYNEK